MSTKVLVIGLDGATFKVIHPLVRTGHLPTLARLMEEGASGELRSTMPPVSGPAWHAFKTGKNPGRTGVYDFVKYYPRRYQSSVIQLGQLPDPKLWDIIEHYSDYQIGIYNLPTTYPPVKINGFMVAGFPLPDDVSDYTYPLGLKTELDRVTGGHKTDIRYRDYKRHEDFLADVNNLIDQRVKAYYYLKDKYDPELFIFAFTCTDRVQHRMWKYLDPESDLTDSHSKRYRELLYSFWGHLDKAVGELLKTVDESTTVIIMSDHGFGPQSEVFYVNQWLYQQGYLKLKGSGGQRGPISNLLSRKARDVIHSAINHLPVAKPLGRFAPMILKRALKNEISFEEMVARIDWGQTRAYSPPHTSVFGTIYVNLRGREGHGSVSRYAYDELRDQIISELESLNNEIPNFQVKVFKREDLYHGSYIAQAPDLIYVINDFRCVSRPSLCKGPVFKTRALGDHYSGTHRLEGIFIAKGPSIKQGHRLKHVEIIDIAPTLLHILGIPIPNDMDGKVLKDMFRSNSELARRDINLADTIGMQTAGEPEELLDDSVRKRLEDLGYL